MTNKELIKRFFRGKHRGDEESYGFSIKPLRKYKECVGDFSLYSKISQFPMASKVSPNYFIVSTSSTGTNHGPWKKHVELVTAIAQQMRIDIVFSPCANKDEFQKYMERKINGNLVNLAQDLRTGMYKSIYRDTENDSFKLKYAARINEPAACYAVPNNYKKLMENIHTLLEGEIRLRLPKNQISLVDTDETQSLWRWLIKDNTSKKDREILTKMYTLSRLLGNRQKEVQFWQPEPGKKYSVTIFPT